MVDSEMRQISDELTDDMSGILPFAAFVRRHDPEWLESSPGERRRRSELLRSIVKDSNVLGLIAKYTVVSSDVADLLRLADKHENDIPF